MQIVAFPPADAALRRQAAELLVEAFPHEDGWPTLEAAAEEVSEALAPDRRCRAALDDGGRLLGWVGSIPGYRGRVWELHPLVVRASDRRRGVGRALVRDLERTLGAEGGITLWLGTEDDGRTSLAGVDLFPAPIEQLRALRVPDGHPVAFYLKIGFAVCGVIPDAVAPGRPDILMGRRIG